MVTAQLVQTGIKYAVALHADITVFTFVVFRALAVLIVSIR